MQTRASVIEYFNDEFDAETAKFAEKHLRPALSLVVSGLASGRSRLGGEPDLAPGESVPRYSTPGQFLGQIEFADVPESFRSSVAMPERGLLRLWTSCVDDQDAGYTWEEPDFVRGLFTEAAISPTMHPGLPIALVPGWDLPLREHVGSRYPWRQSCDEEDAYLEVRGMLRASCYLFGYPDHVSLGYDPTPAGMVPLASFGSIDMLGWDWHDGGFLQVFVPPDDLASGNFSRLACDAG